MFEKNKELYCESCSKLNSKDYDLITNHIRENPGATVIEVITATGATLKGINCFIEDGSISYVGDVTGTKGKQINIPEKVESKSGRFHTRRSR